MELVPQSFSKTLLARGFRDNSVRLYTYYCVTLLEYFGVAPSRLTSADILDWIGYAQAELEWKARTVNVALASMRILFEVVRKPAVMAGIRNLRFDHPEPRVLSASEVSMLFSRAETLTLRTAIGLLYGAGLRISELLALRFEDIDSARGVLRIEKAKNRHARDAMLPGNALPLLRELWKVRRAHGGVALKDLVLVSREGKQLRRDVIGTALVRCAEQCNVTKRVYPHLLRHSFATNLIERGAALTTVQQLLGHRSLSSTARYVHLTAATRNAVPSPFDALSIEPVRK